MTVRSWAFSLGFFRFADCDPRHRKSFLCACPFLGPYSEIPHVPDPAVPAQVKRTCPLAFLSVGGGMRCGGCGVGGASGGGVAGAGMSGPAGPGRGTSGGGPGGLPGVGCGEAIFRAADVAAKVHRLRKPGFVIVFPRFCAP
jgi:hypothetical protein